MADEHRTHLQQSLVVQKLDLRDDSVICQRYIDGNEDKNVDDIVHEMALMHWLHNYTTYRQDLRLMVDHLMAKNGVFKGVWRKASLHIKSYYAVCHLPKTWPWLVE